jgi:hypothetical protein
MDDRPGGERSASDRGGGRRRIGLGSRRVVWGAFLISIVAHLAVIAIYPLFAPRLRPDGARFSVPRSSRAPQGMRVLRIVEIDAGPEPTRPDMPDEVEDVAEPQADTELPVIDGAPTSELPPPPPSAAARLRPRLTERRLWAPLDDPALRELTMEQREELALAGRLTAWRDSVEAALEAESALTDWTFKDKEGKRWGVSEGKLHLGDLTLPLPFSFGTTVGKRDEVAKRMWQWEEIQRQGARAAIEDSWKERSAAIRARRDKERAEAKPDTTRSSRRTPR